MGSRFSKSVSKQYFLATKNLGSSAFIYEFKTLIITFGIGSKTFYLTTLMNLQNLFFHLGLGLAIGGASAPLETSVLAQAFIGDTQGIMFYDSGVAGIGQPGQGVTRNRLEFASASQKDAVNQVAARVVAELSNNSLTGSLNEAIPNTLQQTLLTLLTNPTPDSRQSIVNELNAAGASTVEAEALANSLSGLISITGSVDAAKLLAAVRAYNPVINSANEQFLRNPPPEIAVIRRVLSVLVQAAAN